jgi:hypothetical protein
MLYSLNKKCSFLFKTPHGLSRVVFILVLSLPLQLFAADGHEKVIFAARHYLLKGASHFRMWQANPDGSGKRPIRWADGVPFFAVPSPSGRRYLYSV